MICTVCTVGMEFWKQLCAEHGINPGKSLNHNFNLYKLSQTMHMNSVIGNYMYRLCSLYYIAMIYGWIDLIMLRNTCSFKINTEGILESTDAEGIDRKDVFFYQVGAHQRSCIYTEYTYYSRSACHLCIMIYTHNTCLRILWKLLYFVHWRPLPPNNC